MNKKAQEEGYANGITDILRKKCASAIIEMEAITEDGYRKGMIDIFLEQGFTHLLHFCVVNYKIFFVFHFPWWFYENRNFELLIEILNRNFQHNIFKQNIDF